MKVNNIKIKIVSFTLILVLLFTSTVTALADTKVVKSEAPDQGIDDYSYIVDYGVETVTETFSIILGSLKDSKILDILGVGGAGLKLLFSLIALGSESETDQKLNEILNAIEELKRQNDVNTKKILNKIQETEFATDIKNFQGELDKMRLTIYRLNPRIEDGLKELNSENKPSDEDAIVIRQNFRKVYHTEVDQYIGPIEYRCKDENTVYLDKLRVFSSKILNSINGPNGIFGTNYNYNSILHMFNTNTFKQRDSFNKTIFSEYVSGYATLKSAIEYDKAYNEGEKEKITEELNKLSGKKPEDLTQEEKKDKSNLEKMLACIKQNVKSAENDLKSLQSDYDKVAKACDAEQKKLNDEKTRLNVRKKDACIYHFATKSYFYKRVRRIYSWETEIELVNHRRVIRDYRFVKGDTWNEKVQDGLLKAMQKEFDNNKTDRFVIYHDNSTVKKYMAGLQDDADVRGVNLFNEMQKSGFDFDDGVKTLDDCKKKNTVGFYASENYAMFGYRAFEYFSPFYDVSSGKLITEKSAKKEPNALACELYPESTEPYRNNRLDTRYQKYVFVINKIDY